MKKLLLLSVYLLSYVYHFSQEKEYYIYGSISTDTTFQNSFFVYEQGNGARVDSCRVNEGKFFFFGKANSPFYAYLYFSDNDTGIKTQAGRLGFFVEPGNSVYIKINNSVEDANITGSPLNTSYMAYKKGMEMINEEFTRLKSVAANSSPEQSGSEYFRDSINRQLNIIAQMHHEKPFSYVRRNPESYLSLYLLKSAIQRQPAEYERVEEAFNSLTHTLKSSITGKELSEIISSYKPLPAGMLAPFIEARKMNTNALFKLDDLKGKNILLQFWSPDCNHCKEEIAQLLELKDTFKEKSVELVLFAVQTPDEQQKWRESITEYGLSDFYNITDYAFWYSPVLKAYHVYSVPLNYFINREGYIIKNNFKISAINDLLNTLL